MSPHQFSRDKPMDAITLNQVNHFILRKQHLTDDTKTDEIVQTVRDIGGLHATNPTTPYLSLFARIDNFAKEKLDKKIHVERRLGAREWKRTHL